MGVKLCHEATQSKIARLATVQSGIHNGPETSFLQVAVVSANRDASNRNGPQRAIGRYTVALNFNLKVGTDRLFHELMGFSQTSQIAVLRSRRAACLIDTSYTEWQC